MRVGDIFEVKLENGRKKYFQFIGKDNTELWSHVIRVFINEYDSTYLPTMDEIVSAPIQFYRHVHGLNWALKQGFWTRYGNSKEIGTLDIVFRAAHDYGQHPRQKFISEQWIVWKMNSDFRFVGRLPKKYYNASLGDVYSPWDILYLIQTGEEKHIFYPDYK